MTGHGNRRCSWCVTPEDAATPISARSSTRAAPRRRCSCCRNGGRCRTRRMRAGCASLGLLPPLRSRRRARARQSSSRSAARKAAASRCGHVDSRARRDALHRAARVVQSMSGARLKPLITDARRRHPPGQDRQPAALRARAIPTSSTIMRWAARARPRSALALLDILNSTGAQIGLVRRHRERPRPSQSPLKLAFDPPFLAVTLIDLRGHAARRAGRRSSASARSAGPQRAIAFGKAALVDNSAALVRKAGARRALGGRYAE